MDRESCIIFGVMIGKEWFREKTAPEAVNLLLKFAPEISEITLVSYRRKFDGVYLDIEPETNSFPREQALDDSFWVWQWLQLKEVSVEHIEPGDENLATNRLSRKALKAMGTDPRETEDKIWEAMDETQEWWTHSDDEVYLALGSKVKTGQEWLQLPFMDFTCSPSPKRLALIKQLWVESGVPEGVVFKSGVSYHFWGLSFLDQPTWERWMRNWWWKPWADNHFIEHSICSQRNWLRITAGASKPDIPIVIDVV